MLLSNLFASYSVVAALAMVMLSAGPVSAQQQAKPMLPAGSAASATASEAAPYFSLPEMQAQEPGVQKAQQLLHQMIEALGGRAWLDMQDMQQEGRTYLFSHGEPSGEGAVFRRLWKWPDKQRVEFSNKRELPLFSVLPPVPLKSVSWVVIENGNEGYEITYRGPAKQDKEVLQDYLRRRNHSLKWVLRKWLKEPGVAIFYEGKAVAARKPAEQVTIMNAQNDAVTIWIDSDTHLPLKKAFTWRDPKTRYRTEEAEAYENYRPVQGVMVPLSITRYRNDDAVNQVFVSQVSINQGLSDVMFDAKAVAAPQKK
ncbi:MAG: hypothetical protein ACE14M_01020 [Terriglobales bacterium]